jgi:aldose 1-epimerase
VLQHDYAAGEWPWSYRALQGISLDAQGLTLTLSIENRCKTKMPAGLGFHPYFPMTPDTVYRGLHRGEWSNSEDCLPVAHEERPGPIDWWSGRPVAARNVDTVYSGRSGPLEILWPSHGCKLTLQPSFKLSHTVVFTPRDADFFCVEPVSHRTDAINVPWDKESMQLLDPDDTFDVGLRLCAQLIEDRAINESGIAFPPGRRSW